MTDPPRPYLVSCCDLDGDGAHRERRFADPVRAAAWADRATGRYTSVEVLVLRPGGAPVAVRDRAALAAAVGEGR